MDRQLTYPNCPYFDHIRFSADVELPLLQMAMQTEQYAQAMSVRPTTIPIDVLRPRSHTHKSLTNRISQQIKATFDRLQRMSLLLPYRPKKSVKEDPRAWWRYAYFCVRRATKSLGIAEVGDMVLKGGRGIAVGL